MLDPGNENQLLYGRGTVRDYSLYHDNDWSTPPDTVEHRDFRMKGGAYACTRAPITMLTPKARILREDIDALSHAEGHGSLTHLGVVWALRTLSPLWQDVWKRHYEGTWRIEVRADTLRPAYACDAQGEPEGCIAGLEKSILLIADGETNFGPVGHSRLTETLDQAEEWGDNRRRARGICHHPSYGE